MYGDLSTEAWLCSRCRKESRWKKIWRWFDEVELRWLPTPLALLGGPFTTNIPKDEERAAQELHQANLARSRSM